MRHLPNALTVLRILLALLFPFVAPGGRIPIVSLALLTEYLDGTISRAYGTTSRLGQLLDPIADKLFFLAVAATFIREGDLTVAQFALLALRDLAVLAAVLWTLALGKRELMGKMKPLFLGKAATVFQYFVCFDVLLGGGLRPALFYATALVSLMAAAQYAIAFRTLLRDGPA